jgi:DNA polymerase
MIIGEAWGEEEERTGQAFAGMSGSIIKGLLRQVGISLHECYLTNVFNFQLPGNNILNICGLRAEGIPMYRPISKSKYIRVEFLPEIERLWAEIEQTKPNLIIALGNTALWAVCKKSGIKKYRGSPLMSYDGRFKVLPTWNPGAIRKQWELRVVTLADLHKARVESDFPELRRPERFIYMEPTIQDIKDFYRQYLKDQPFISCDVETKEGTITEVGYATADGKHCLVIPFWDRRTGDGNYWTTLAEEREAWSCVRYINTHHKLIGQNFAYDMQYFWRTMGIPCPKFLGDTMLLHHAMQPEMEKSLGFLGSLYTNEPSWKFMRTDHSTLKLGDD